MQQFFARALFGLGLLLGMGPASAHEFWLDPVDFTPKVGARVPIVWRNGQNYLGDSYPFERKWSKRFSVVDAKGERQIKATPGDDPAAEVPLISPGLAIVVFQRAPDIADYKSLDHFLEVLDDEGLDDVAARYRTTPNAPQKLQEVYSRYAKALLAVGSVAGDDKAVGLALEIVVETNPYARQAGTPVIARVLQDGKPVVGVQLKVFNRSRGSDAAVEPRRLRTDADGRVRIDGLVAGEVLLNVAVMKPAAPLAADIGLQTRWDSQWATVTFKTP